MTDVPAWRYVDHLQLNFPPADIVALPPQVLEAVEHEQVRSAGLSRALDQRDVALIELEAARAADANAELDAASSDARPAKQQQPKALEKVDLAKRAVEAHRGALKEARRVLLNLIWDVREGWAERVMQEREQGRTALVAMLDEIGAAFDQLAIRDTFLDGLVALEECGGMAASVEFAVPASSLEHRAQHRADLIEAALDTSPNQLGYRLPPEVAESLAGLAQHLRPVVSSEYSIAAW